MKPVQSWRGAAALALALVSASAGAAAQEIAAWFGSAPEAAAYAAVKDRITSIAEEAARGGVPESILLERLIEGTRKRVAPERLASALEAEAARLESVALLLKGRDLGAAALSELIGSGGLLLRSGATLDELGRSLAAGGPGDEGARRAFAAVSVLTGLYSRFGLNEAERNRLLEALARSSIPRTQFSSLISLFARWRASGLTVQHIATTVAQAIEGGSSLERIERELERRTTKP